MIKFVPRNQYYKTSNQIQTNIEINVGTQQALNKNFFHQVFQVSMQTWELSPQEGQLKQILTKLSSFVTVTWSPLSSTTGETCTKDNSKHHVQGISLFVVFWDQLRLKAGSNHAQSRPYLVPSLVDTVMVLLKLDLLRGIGHGNFQHPAMEKQHQALYSWSKYVITVLNSE